MSGRMSAPGTSCSKETVLRVGLEGKIKHCYAFGVPALGQRSNMCARCDYSGRKRNFFEGKLSSRYIQGHRVFHQGISMRPAIGCQAEFAQALQTFLQSEHLLVGLLTGTS